MRQQLKQAITPDRLKLSFADIPDEIASPRGTFFPAHCRAIGLNPASDPQAACLLGIDQPGDFLMTRRSILRPDRFIQGIWARRPVTGGTVGLNVPSDATRFFIFDLWASDEQASYAGGDGLGVAAGIAIWTPSRVAIPGAPTLATKVLNQNNGRARFIVSNVSGNGSRLYVAEAQTHAGPVNPDTWGVLLAADGASIDRPYTGAIWVYCPDAAGGTAQVEEFGS